MPCVGGGWEPNGEQGLTQDPHKGSTGEGVPSRWAQAKEGRIAGPAGGEEAESGNWAFDATDFWGNQANAFAERVGLGGWEGDDGVVVVPGHRANGEDGGAVGSEVPDDLTRTEEAGEGKRKGGLKHQPVAPLEGRERLDRLDDPLEEGEGDGKLGSRPADAMEALVATESTFETSTGEACEVETQVDVVGAEGAQVMLGGVEGLARGGEVAKPFEELGAGGWEADSVEAKVTEAESVELGGGTCRALSSAGGKTVPEEGGCVVRDAEAMPKGRGWGWGWATGAGREKSRE